MKELKEKSSFEEMMFWLTTVYHNDNDDIRIIISKFANYHSDKRNFEEFKAYFEKWRKRVRPQQVSSLFEVAHELVYMVEDDNTKSI